MIGLEIVLYYCIITNAVSAALCITDKIWAKKGSSIRVPEKTLFSWSIAGGALFMYITMILIRHKTKHKRFMIGLPIIILLQSVVLLWLLHITA